MPTCEVLQEGRELWGGNQPEKKAKGNPPPRDEYAAWELVEKDREGAAPAPQDVAGAPPASALSKTSLCFPPALKWNVPVPSSTRVFLHLTLSEHVGSRAVEEKGV